METARGLAEWPPSQRNIPMLWDEKVGNTGRRMHSFEAVKKFLEKQKRFMPQPTDKVEENAKKTKQLFFARRCALVRRLTDEIVDFFTASLSVCASGSVN